MGKQTSYSRYKNARDLYEEYGSANQVGMSGRMPRQTCDDLLKRGKLLKHPESGVTYEQHYNEQLESKTGAFKAPQLSDPEMPVDDLWDHMGRQWDRRSKAAADRKWMRFKMRGKEPFALVFVGDPHMGDNGANMRLFRRHIDLIQQTPRVWGVGMGDYTNHWAGRLAEKIYPHQEITRTQERRLIEWLVKREKSSGESIWWMMILGNHDVWGTDGAALLSFMSTGRHITEDWEVCFVIECGGVEYKIRAAHNFKGTSIYNPLHGPLRKSIFTGFDADLYIAGDRHHWALMHLEDEQNKGSVAWIARARGYKFLDPHAIHGGFGSQEYGASICAVFNPDAGDIGKLQCFADVEDGLNYLAFIRS